MSKEPVKFCSLQAFLKQHHKALFDAMDYSCMAGLLGTRHTGKTLLLPSDAEIKKLVSDLSKGSTQEEAQQYLKALIINEYLPDTASWARSKSKLTNALYQKVEVVGGATKKGETVLLKGADGKPVEICLCSEFVSNEHGPNKSCVWEIVKGRLSISGEKVPFVRHDEKKKREGGSVVDLTTSPRELFDSDCWQSCKELRSGKVSKNPITEHVLSFMKWSAKHDSAKYYAKHGTLSP